MPDDRSLVARSWTHAHEEDAGPDRVYRPSDAVFPPSRGRSVVMLNPDGTLVLGGPGPDDRSGTAAGRWTLDGATLTLAPAAGSPRSYDVASVAADRLVLRPLPEGTP